jgi:hypothetical protein
MGRTLLGRLDDVPLILGLEAGVTLLSYDLMW